MRLEITLVKRVSPLLALMSASVLLLAACGGGGSSGPVIDSLNCAPAVVKTGETVSCVPLVEGPVDTYIWSAAGGSPTNGTESSFSTQYGSTGDVTISLLVCRGGGCSNESQSVEVSTTASTSEPSPTVGSLHCSPTFAITDEPIVCSPTVKGTVTAYVWSAFSGGSPSTGGEVSFTTTYSETGTKTINLQVCNSGGCNSKLQSVLVGPPPDPPDSDGDGVSDPSDNCEFTTNPDQSDVDGDSRGDACDSQDGRDPDGDGFQNWEDSCPDEAENLNGYLDGDGCPQDPEVAVSIEQGDGTVFGPGEIVTVCYSAGGPMFVDIDLVAPSGTRSDLLSAFDVEGTGGCFDWELPSEAQPGVYAVEITGSGADDTASFEIA